jgi:hypothetical protein
MMATWAPSVANNFAVARPMPLAAPVMMATQPAIERERLGLGIFGSFAVWKHEG